MGQRLATHLQSTGYYTWENIEFSNPMPAIHRTWGVVRPDVFACRPVLRAEGASPTIYEVKVSRSDFLADLANPEKRQAYAELAQAVYYCCSEGLIQESDVPKNFGLIWETHPGTFEIQKRAKRTKGFVIAVDTVMTLMVKRQVPLNASTLED